MAHNLKRFVNETEYQQATLNYPAVSWVTGTDAVHFDKAAPATNDKVMMAFQSNAAGKDIILWNSAVSLPPTDLFTDLSVNDVNVIPLLSDASGVLHNYTQANTTYVAKYGLVDDSQITDIFSGDLGGGWGSMVGPVEFFVPSSVTEITSLPDNANKVVINSETVPSISLEWSSMNSIDLYVPDSAVSAYQTELGGHWSGSINGLSQYSGNLPL